MRLSIRPSGSKVYFYVIRSIKRDGKRSSEVVEKLGTADEIMAAHNCDDPEAWARSYVEELNLREKEKTHKVLIPMHTDTRLPMDRQNSFNIGYLFLQQLYYQLRLPYICKKISERHGFQYDMDSILSRLIYGRILYPSSKLSCYEQSGMLYEQPNFELQHVYRALSVLAEESDFIQAQLYKNSCKLMKRRTGVLYYDCTNYFFEITHEDELRKYGYSKEHRPNPIVQMGLFMDRSGIPLAFNITPGSQNEQTTLRPLEQQIQKDFELSRFVVCTDAGLASEGNRMYNNFGERYFITTQPLKKLKKELRDWALDTEGWSLPGHKGTYSIKDLEDTPENRRKTFYKQRYVEGYDVDRDIEFNQTLIVTYSLKYKLYQENVRNSQIQRAVNLLKRPAKADKSGPNDAKRFIKKNKITKDGELAEVRMYELDQKLIDEEARYDGFYASCTNLDDDPMEIIRVNQGRWEIEESFRIMKSEFEARPVYLQRQERIMAHFLTCFISLLIYRLLEYRLNKDEIESQLQSGGCLERTYSCEDITDTLKAMSLARVGTEGYVPTYTRTALTDALHEAAGFRTDYEFATERSVKGYCRRSKGL